MARPKTLYVTRCKCGHILGAADFEGGFKTCFYCRHRAKRYYLRKIKRKPCRDCGKPSLLRHRWCAEHLGHALLAIQNIRLNAVEYKWNPDDYLARNTVPCPQCNGKKRTLIGYDMCEDCVVRSAVFYETEIVPVKICPICHITNCRHHPKPRFCEKCGRALPWEWAVSRQFGRADVCWPCFHGIDSEEDWIEACKGPLLPEPLPYPEYYFKSRHVPARDEGRDTDRDPSDPLGSLPDDTADEAVAGGGGNPGSGDGVSPDQTDREGRGDLLHRPDGESPEPSEAAR